MYSTGVHKGRESRIQCMGTILTMAITIDNYWFDLIIIKESYCDRRVGG